MLPAYLDEVRPALPGCPHFFVNPKSIRGRQFHGRFGPRSVHGLVRLAGEGAGVPGRHFPHRRRHTWATGLLRHREDLHVAQRLLGHSTMATIIGYVHRSDADLMDAVDRAFPAA
ncbi:MAG TPA: tyrosine-type recombinase/integrase [Acidimicrobiales bacterium]|nr:tyrosine-type recombinase/integrase [Acidimicrobiales bacterium]